VMDLFSRQIIGWSMNERMTSDLALNALLMAVWRRKPKTEVMVHSDQGSQFSSYDWQDFLRANNLLGSMSRRGNCHDNAVAESFFQLLRRERIKRKIYTTRKEARQDVFDYIERFYNPKRRHSHANDMSPVEYEKQYLMRLGAVYKIRGDSYPCTATTPSRICSKNRQISELAHGLGQLLDNSRLWGVSVFWPQWPGATGAATAAWPGARPQWTACGR